MAWMLSPAAQQTTGSISGKASDEARQPFSDYAVQLRDASTGQIASTVPLDTKGLFTFADVELQRQFLVELYNTKENKLICTEGPYVLATQLPNKTDVNIDCGRAPAALWLLAAGAGTAAAIAIATTSASQ